MDNTAFHEIVNRRIELIRITLTAKGREYQAGIDDAFINFKNCARIRNTTKEEMVLHLAVKHQVSIEDMVRHVKEDILDKDYAYIEEKIGDAINYLIILEAMLKDETHAIH